LTLNLKVRNLEHAQCTSRIWWGLLISVTRSVNRISADDSSLHGRCSLSGMDDHCSPCIGVHLYRYNTELDAVNHTPTKRRQDRINLIWTTPRRLPLLPVTPRSDPVGSETRSPSSSVHVLGVYIDADLSMRTHVNCEFMTTAIVASCSIALHSARFEAFCGRCNHQRHRRYSVTCIVKIRIYMATRLWQTF